MSEHTMEKSIAEQMLDWAERLDKRFHAFNKQSLYNWLVVKAPRIAELEKFNLGLDAISLLQDKAFTLLEEELKDLKKKHFQSERDCQMLQDVVNGRADVRDLPAHLREE